MHKYLSYAAYGFLAFSGTLHFVIDVVAQKLRGVRAPSPETTLYWGLNSGYALGQVILGVLGLWLTHRSLELVRAPLMLAVSLLAGAAWLAITILFMEYREPKIAISIYLVLAVAAALGSLRAPVSG